MWINELGVRNEDESMRIGAAFLHTVSPTVLRARSDLKKPTQFSHFSHRQSSTLSRIADRSPLYTTTNQTTHSTLTKLIQPLQFQLPLLIPFHLLSTSGLTLKITNARATLHA
jgi:hypothetical protein